MSTIAFIPARCGSKSISLKNIKEFCGKPLIYWNILSLQNCSSVDKIAIATDCSTIEETVREFQFSKVDIYRRSNENAGDTASTESVMLEYLNISNLNENDTFILVQATSPLTQEIHFTEALEKYRSEIFDSLLTCVRWKRFFWTSGGNSENYDYKNRPRRQDFDGQLMENGAFYINSVTNILQNKNRLSGKIGIYEMPEYTAVEIDEEDDWIIAEKLMYKHILNTKHNKKIKLFLSDIDGVLTDAGMYYSEKGDELKKFCTYDGMAFNILQTNNIQVGIITGENRELNRRRVEKLKLDFAFHGETNKLETVTDLCTKIGISLSEVAYIGDDINDFELLSNVGLAACPANAVKKIKDIPNIIHLQKKGGEGAVREFSEIILSQNLTES